MLRIHNDNHVERVKQNPDFSIESRSNGLSLSCMFRMHHDSFIYISNFVCKIAIFALISFFSCLFVWIKWKQHQYWWVRRSCCLISQKTPKHFDRKKTIEKYLQLFTEWFACLSSIELKKNEAFTHIVHCDCSRYFWAALDCDNS